MLRFRVWELMGGPGLHFQHQCIQLWTSESAHTYSYRFCSIWLSDQFFKRRKTSLFMIVMVSEVFNPHLPLSETSGLPKLPQRPSHQQPLFFSMFRSCAFFPLKGQAFPTTLCLKFDKRFPGRFLDFNILPPTLWSNQIVFTFNISQSDNFRSESSQT